MNSLYAAVAASLREGPVDNGESVTASFVFTGTFAGFDGHFPGNPVVPGIAQIYAAMITLGGSMALSEVRRCKFMRPVLPDEAVAVTVFRESTEAALRCKAEVTANGEVCATMNLVLTPAE